jgi:hypothetical protein
MHATTNTHTYHVCLCGWSPGLLCSMYRHIYRQKHPNTTPKHTITKYKKHTADKSGLRTSTFFLFFFRLPPLGVLHILHTTN